MASTPPICALPSDEIDSGSRQPASAAAFCAAFSVTPASIVMVRSTGSIARTRFSRAKLSTNWLPSASGVAPPTIEVLPPCGTRGTRAAAHSRTTAASSTVSAGRTTAGVRP